MKIFAAPQTANKTDPFLITQPQAIHTRAGPNYHPVATATIDEIEFKGPRI